MFGAETKRLAVRHDNSSHSSLSSSSSNSYLPSHSRSSLAAHINKDRLTARSPSFDKHGNGGWTSVWIVRLPFSRLPRRLVLPIPPGGAAIIRRHLISRPKTTLTIICIGVLLFFNVLGVVRKILIASTRVLPTTSDTCVFPLRELRDLYTWEVQSGNYPTRRRIPPQIGIPADLYNPSTSLHNSLQSLSGGRGLLPSELDNTTQPTGPPRTYISPFAPRSNQSFPPRPVKGSIADLDIIHAYCDYNTGQYVRDCLEVMKVGAGLDNGRRMRRGSTDKWRYIYTEDHASSTHKYSGGGIGLGGVSWMEDSPPPKTLLRETGPERLNLSTLPTMPHVPQYTRTDGSCDQARPRIFHMYWSGPFTDKPYLTLMSYLYTQPLALHHPPRSWEASQGNKGCKPEFWVWINPGVHASVPNPSAKTDMFDTLLENPWSAPFLHERFRDIIKFKMWNTTERLDAHPELKGWRTHGVLGKLAVEPDTVIALSDASALLEELDESASRAGTTQKKTSSTNAKAEAAMVQLKAADSAQVVMSDLARFLVTHAFGGCYLDVDNVLLRDWEELWGWRGAFAMRWSVHEWYNTAVLRMHEDSALGRFLLKTAMASTSDVPFHPFTITKYVDDAHLAPVLTRIPDALFDPNFLNMEKVERERERPPFPAFSWESKFEEFFVTPVRTGGAGLAAGFESFFRGAYSYHWHNNWEKPVDLGRNFPDMGSRFARGEKVARTRHVASLRSKVLAAATAGAHVKQDRDDRSSVPESGGAGEGVIGNERNLEELLWEDSPENDERDLSWSAVLKRTFEAYVRGEIPNMYGEWMVWE